jgi:GntR family galactonate operon transcriptional repressor
MTILRGRLSQQFASDFLQVIIREMQPGDEIASEADLARSFDVSRTSVREGIQEISSMGLVVRRQGRRTMIAPRDNWDMLNPRLLAAVMANDQDPKAIFEDLFDVRISIECLAAEKAACRRTPEDLKLLAQRLENVWTCFEDADGFIRADVAYHAAIHTVSHDLVVSSILRMMRGLLEASRTFTQQLAPEFARGASHHAAIYAAIAAGDPEAARQAMWEHLTWSRSVSVFERA